MATIVQRGKSWLVRIHLKDEKQLCRTFDTHNEASRWARAMENRMDDGIYNDLTEAQRTRLLEALGRYEREITRKPIVYNKRK